MYVSPQRKKAAASYKYTQPCSGDQRAMKHNCLCACVCKGKIWENISNEQLNHTLQFDLKVHNFVQEYSESRGKPNGFFIQNGSKSCCPVIKTASVGC